MLHLKARIHLHEVDGFICKIVDELDSTGADVADLVRDRLGAITHLRLQLC